MSRLPSVRFVKLYFRDEKKIMRSIPEFQAMLVDDVLAKVYTHDERGLMMKLIYEVENK